MTEKIASLCGIVKIRLKCIANVGRISVGKKVRVKPDIILRNHMGNISLGNCFLARNKIILNSSENGEIIVGNNVFFNDGVLINARKRITIGDGCILGQNVMIYDHDHDYKKGPTEKITSFVSNEVSIGKNVWIGSGTIILNGTEIGDNSVIGAGCIIKGKIASNMLVYSSQKLISKDLGGFNE